MAVAARPVAGLVGAALISELVYLGAAGRLPWWRYGSRLRSWHELLGPGWGPPAACLAGVGLLLSAYFFGWWLVRRAGAGNATRHAVWGGAIVFAATLFWVLPVTSDLFTYLVQAHLLTDNGANPYVTAPFDVRNNRLLQAYPAAYHAYPSVYGPAWLLLSVPATLGPHDVAVGLLYLKGLAGLSFLGCAWVLDRIVREVKPRGQRPPPTPEALYLFAWNPLVLWMSVGDGHNDIAMMFFVLLAVWCLVRQRWTLAFGLLALSAWIKYVSLALFPLFLLHAWRYARPGATGRVLFLGRVLLAMAAVSLVAYCPFLLLDGPPAGLTGTVSDQADHSWVRAVAQRLLQPRNWAEGSQVHSGWMLKAGALLFAAGYLGIMRRFLEEHGSLAKMLELAVVVVLLAFVLGAARSQPWHLVWPASLAGLSGRRWTWPVVAGLSAVMMGAQVWVEWGAPGWSLLS